MLTNSRDMSWALHPITTAAVVCQFHNRIHSLFITASEMYNTGITKYWYENIGDNYLSFLACHTPCENSCTGLHLKHCSSALLKCGLMEAADGRQLTVLHTLSLSCVQPSSRRYMDKGYRVLRTIIQYMLIWYTYKYVVFEIADRPLSYSKSLKTHTNENL